MLTKKELSSVIIAAVLAVLTFASSSCSGRYLKTESAVEQEIAGNYTLILYGGRSVNDLITIAILAKEGTPYAFEVYAPDFEYKAIKGVPAKDAWEMAEKFVSFHHSFWKTQLSKIIDNQGKTIGYEVRPLYYPVIRNQSDILDVYYKKSDGKVTVYIKSYEYPGGESFPFEGGRGIGPK
jgi:hypothetical protein